ncbi:MAG: CRISPR-associated helicase Cas3' [Fervidobacterium sp.]|uniref:CRISPR-associated helicase Cas3' n=1 Tax=Fervidobacterium sp. TaxID=1871331 RepID=UPI00404AAF03
MEYFARPGEILRDHHLNVWKTASKYLSESGIEDNDFRQVVKYTCLFHDFGKYTKYFQEKIRSGRNDIKSRHSFISALITAAYLYTKIRTDSLLVLSAYFSVLSHHTDLSNISDFLPNSDFCKGSKYPNSKILFENINIAYSQLDDLNQRAQEIIEDYSRIGIDVDENLFKKEVVRDTLCKLREQYKHLEQSENEEVAVQTQLLFSILVDADKKDAAGYIPENERADLPPNMVDLYKLHKFPSTESEENPIYKIREEIYRTVEEEILSQELNENSGKIFRLTAPTGTGKTLASLNAAVKLREKLRLKFGYRYRIIYALPLITIVEQTKSVIEEILSLMIPNYSNEPTKYFIAHYHLSDTYERKDVEIHNLMDEQLDYSTSVLQLESWDTEIVLTTFYQLMYTLLGYKNKLMKKFYKLYRSIIIIDEIQSIPVEFMPLIEKFIEILETYMNSYIILMSATQPAICSNSKELNKKIQSVFANLERTQIIKRFDVTDFDTLKALIEEHIYKKSVLIVLNTVTDSINYYRLIKNAFNIEQDRIFYLSTNITPKHRWERIAQIKESLENGAKILVVSTQVVEAGVDLDFEVVFRDVGPLSSIIQIAGRCNRNYQFGKSHLYLLNLFERHAIRVYGGSHIELTKQLIENKNVIDEKEYLDISLNYEKSIRDFVSKNTLCRMIFENYKVLNFSSDEYENTLTDFKIMTFIPSVEIFISEKKEDEEIYNHFVSLAEISDRFERKRTLSKVRRKFEERIVSVNIERAKKNLPPATSKYENIRFVSYDELEKYYSLETGFKYLDEDSHDVVIW